MPGTTHIKNIIFDLGGVILPIEIERTKEAFSRLGLKGLDNLFRIGHADSFFRDYEEGLISDNQFIAELGKEFNNTVPDDIIINAWNALLLDFIPERIDLLKRLGKQYRVFLFSNTNGIHHASFHRQYRDRFSGENFDSLFEKAWYSHLIRYRKPDIRAYEFVTGDAGINPAETLFVDDSLVNIEGAIAAGLQGIHLTAGKTIMELF